MKEKLLVLLLVLVPTLLIAQVGFYSNVYVGSNVELGIHSNQVRLDAKIQSTNLESGSISFYSDNTFIVGGSAEAFLELNTTINGNSIFDFPLGADDVYQPIRVTGSDENIPMTVRFIYDSFSDLEVPTESNIQSVNPSFYWEISSSKVGNLIFSWNLFSDLESFLQGRAIDNLLLLGYTGSIWEIIPHRLLPSSIADTSILTSLSEGSLSTFNPIDMSNYTAFTFGSEVLTFPIEVSEAITPNGDGINDTWYIGNIERFIGARIYVYNRWGSLVYQKLGNYQNDWGGTYLDNNEILPEGSYYYKIFFPENSEEQNLDGWIYITQ